jgi:hypothetical protein
VVIAIHAAWLTDVAGVDAILRALPSAGVDAILRASPSGPGW